MVHIRPNEPTITHPEFCPNVQCAHHHLPTVTDRRQWFIRFGTFHTRARGRIHRFRCRSCGKTCSTQTFSTHYWTHGRSNLEHLEHQLTSASGLRQIGRMNGCSYRVVKNRTHRLARQYLTLFAHALASMSRFQEAAAFDGFESFIRSQYFPTNINILVGSDSQACYGVNMTVMRRKGRMTARQKEVRSVIDRVWKPPRRSLEQAVTRLFRDFEPQIMNTIAVTGSWTLHMDEKREYPRGLARCPDLNRAMNRGQMILSQISSRRARTRRNPLFPVNYLDRELRKDMGEHVRETVKQGREVNCAMDRMVIKLGYHTFFKPYRISSRVDTRTEPTHATVAGLDRAPKVASRQNWLYTHRKVYSKLPNVPGGDRPIDWIHSIWQRIYENPPIVDLETGTKKPTGQPKERWFARHLLA